MDRRQKILIIAFILSLLLHIGLFLAIKYFDWFAPKHKLKKEQPTEVEIVFPENKPQPNMPREVVQNMNETEEIPDRADYLSDKNSRARNPEVTQQRSSNPNSKGNVPLSNLSKAPSRRSYTPTQKSSFSKNALRGSSTKTFTEQYQEEKSGQTSMESEGSNQMLNNKDFSVEEVGAMTLSTYRWAWAPYINRMKNKLYRVWYPPTAYYNLGLIHGYTVIRYTIDKQGKLVDFAVLDHNGHESLELSSTKAIEALFPFIPLPDDFPDETLTITAKLIYPNLRSRR